MDLVKLAEALAAVDGVLGRLDMSYTSDTETASECLELARNWIEASMGAILALRRGLEVSLGAPAE